MDMSSAPSRPSRPDAVAMTWLGHERERRTEPAAAAASTSTSASASASASAWLLNHPLPQAQPQPQPHPQPLPPILRHRREEHELEVREACRMMDQGRKGFLNLRELKYVFVACLGYKPSKVEILNMLPPDQLHTQAAFVTYDDACGLVLRKYHYQDPHDEIRHMFQALDIHGRGYLELDDLIDAAQTFAPHLPLSTLLTTFSASDLDRNRKIGWKEFERVMLHTPRTLAQERYSAASSKAGSDSGSAIDVRSVYPHGQSRFKAAHHQPFIPRHQQEGLKPSIPPMPSYDRQHQPSSTYQSPWDPHVDVLWKEKQPLTLQQTPQSMLPPHHASMTQAHSSFPHSSFTQLATAPKSVSASPSLPAIPRAHSSSSISAPPVYHGHATNAHSPSDFDTAQPHVHQDADNFSLNSHEEQQSGGTVAASNERGVGMGSGAGAGVDTITITPSFATSPSSISPSVPLTPSRRRAPMMAFTPNPNANETQGGR